MVNDKFYLSLAINEAWKYQGLTYPNPAVGCVITDKNGAILAIGAHKRAGFAHAELEASKEALKKLNPLFEFPTEPNELHAFIVKNHQNLLKDSTFYVTLEPCAHQGKTPSCADLISALGAKKVVIGAEERDKIADGGIEKLQAKGIGVIKGVLQEECDKLIEPFLLWKKKRFSFFKLAMRLDGTYDNGIVTSLEMRRFTHEMRNVCDLIAIGGQTVRVDKPTLDARLTNGKAPDVLICTKNSVDNSAPLFSVRDRKVIIQNSVDFPEQYKNIMVEGGSNFLEIMKTKVDWFLITHSGTFDKSGQTNPKLDLRLKLLNIGPMGDNIFAWYKKA